MFQFCNSYIQLHMQKHVQYNDILDMDVLKHEVKITSSHIMPYQLPGFLENAFKGNKSFEATFLRMDEEFKNQFYQTVKFFQTDSTALNNPFYIKKYKQLFHQLTNRVKQNNTSLPAKMPQIAISQVDFNIFESQAASLSKNNNEFSKCFKQPESINENNLLEKLNINFNEMDLFGIKDKHNHSPDNKQISPLNQNSPPQQPKIVEHKFQMSGAGSAAIFDVDVDSSPYDFVDDEFGETAKATVQPLYQLKNADALGKSIKMNNVNLEKKQNIVDINDLINIQHVKTAQAPKQTQLVIPINYSLPMPEVNQDEFGGGFSNALTEQIVQTPKANIFQLKLDEEGNQQIEAELEEVKSEDEKNQGSQNKVTTDKDSEMNEVLEDAPKQEKKNAKEIEDEIYRSIEEMETKEVRYQPQIVQQIKQYQILNNIEEDEKTDQRKQSIDIFAMEIEGVGQIANSELQPMQIIAFNFNKQQQSQAQQPVQQQKKEKEQNVVQSTIQVPSQDQQPKIIQNDLPQPPIENTKSQIRWFPEQLPISNTNSLRSKCPEIKRIKQMNDIQIPAQLVIKTLEKWRVFYNKKNYQCQIQFYRQLKQQLQRLQYFDKIEFIEEEMEVVQEIKRLSEQYSKCVELDEEEMVHAVVKGIQKKIMALKKQETKQIADLCIQRNGKSLTAQIYQQVCSRQPQLAGTLIRLAKQAESPEKKLQIFIQVAIISLYSGSSIVSKCKVYKDLTDKFFKSVDTLKLHIQQLRRMNDDSVRQVLKSVKFQQYISGFKKFYLIALKLSDLIKLIEEQSHYRSRINKFRVQLNTIYQALNQQHHLELGQIQQQSQKDWLREYFNPYLEYLSTGKIPENLHLCGICFDENQYMLERKGTLYHAECWNVMKSL